MRQVAAGSASRCPGDHVDDQLVGHVEPHPPKLRPLDGTAEYERFRDCLGISVSIFTVSGMLHFTFSLGAARFALQHVERPLAGALFVSGVILSWRTG